MPPPPGTASRRWRHQILERMAPLFLGFRCWGGQDWAHRRAFPRLRSSLCGSCWPLETPCGHPLPSLPWQMVASLPFLPWAYQLLLGMPSPVLLPEASLSSLLRQNSQFQLFLACVDTSYARTYILSFFVWGQSVNSTYLQ